MAKEETVDAADAWKAAETVANAAGAPRQPRPSYPEEAFKLQETESAAKAAWEASLASSEAQSKVAEDAMARLREAQELQFTQGLQDMQATQTTTPTETKDKANVGPKELLKKIKDAGIAGVISFGLVQTAFWAASIPVCMVVYSAVSGHFPDLSDQEDMAKFGAEAFAYVNVARFAAPLRVGGALALVPWVQANVVDKLGGAETGEAAQEASLPACVYCSGTGQILCGHCLGMRTMSYADGMGGAVHGAECGNCASSGTVVCINCQGSGVSVPEDMLQEMGDEVGFSESDYISLFQETPMPPAEKSTAGPRSFIESRLSKVAASIER